ncbi:hypothetical protein FKR81_26060 [Lentzea tibetensis]|uniref:Uncharacterized protein n=1 Tax=Lentzea tibetensis TaxID=2591470 RepID=A0A563EPR1_9PSEU|nr:hypothetical protein [Lentzea tibetensis]TWP49134.1 hypothetical protein FKR81_26060 [Lentzea tibetensis]
MSAILELVAAGFRMFPLGDPDCPESLVYMRERGHARDMIRVYGPGECEAVRMVHRTLTRRTEGTTQQVVTVVLGWSVLDVWGR